VQKKHQLLSFTKRIINFVFNLSLDVGWWLIEKNSIIIFSGGEEKWDKKV